MNFLFVWGIKFQSYKSEKMILENNNTKQSQYFKKYQTARLQFI